MKSYHWITMLVIVAVAYYAGMKGWLTKAKSAVSSAAGM
jgi:hypothetical protein